MALIHCDFFSEMLGVSTSMCVILPQQTSTQIGMASTASRASHPTLYLLHGLSDDHTIWQRRTCIERYVAEMGLAVVMPAVGRSWYTDMAHGLAYWSFVSEELPALARSFFHLSERREDTFVAGLSMGGYGAFKLAMRCPERYAAAASLSGGMDVAGLARHVYMQGREEFRNVFGDVKKIKGSENDLFHLAEEFAELDGPKPRLYQCCGTEDFIYRDNVKFRDHACKLGLDLTYEEAPGTHNWGFWDEWIQRVLQWLPLGGSEAE